MKKTSVAELTPQQLHQAIAECLTQLETDSSSAEVHFKLGNLYRQQQQWHQAKTSYQKALSIDAELALAHFNLAKVWEQLSKPGKAADQLNLAFKLQPRLATPEQHYRLGQTLEKQHKPGRAAASYRRAIKLKPNFLAAYEALAAIMMRDRRIESALELYRQGIEQNPQNHHFYLALGSALVSLQKWQPAIKRYQQAAELAPDFAPCYCRWGLALAAIDQTQQAIELLQKAIALQEDYGEAHYQLGLLYEQQQKWQQALDIYTKAQKIQQQQLRQSQIRLRITSVYLRLQQYDSAMTWGRNVLQQSPDGSQLETEAIEIYRQILTEYPQVTIQDYYQFAKILRSKGRFAEAIATYQQTIWFNPQFKAPYIDLQYTPVSPEQLNQLIEFYRQILDQYPQIAIAWGNLGDALSQQNLVAEAMKCYRQSSYQRAIQNQPSLAQLDWKTTKQMGPDFIIAGASKCGTSSLYHYLSNHPQILLSHKKEIDFYWQHYHRGIDWYLAHFPTLSDHPHFLTGEATPNYLRFPQVAQRIKATFPQTKIIILLRNPADRAISWHYHRFNTGLTNKDLTTEIDEEMSRLTKISEPEIIETGFYDPDNIISSLYFYKLRAWIDILGWEQFLILKSEDFYNDPGSNMAKVFEFLRLPNHTLNRYPQVNAGSYNEVDSALRAKLSEYFVPYNQQLESYLGMKFDWQ